MSAIAVKLCSNFAGLSPTGVAALRRPAPVAARRYPGSLAHERQRQRPRRLQRLAPAAAAAAARGTAPPAASSSSTMQPAERPGDKYFTASDSRPIILFDGVCNLCNGGVNMCLDWDTEGAFRFAALQSQAGRELLQRSGRRPDDISSIVLVEPGASHIKAAAVLRIASRLRVPLPLVAAALDVFPHPLKDFVYDGVAANRYLLFGRTPSCRLSDARFEERFVS